MSRFDIHCPDCRVRNGSKHVLNWEHKDCVRRFELSDEFDEENPCVNFGKEPRICLELARYEWYKAVGETY